MTDTQTTTPVDIDIVSIISDIREKEIAEDFSDAFAELQTLVKTSPLETTFKVTVPKQTAPELAHRFSSKPGCKAVVCTYFISNACHLEITVALPENLIHKELAESKVLDEKEMPKVEVAENK